MKKPDKSYGSLLKEIKEKIQSARTRACLAVNREMILLYWEIGKLIARRQEEEGWGKAIVEKLSKDLEEEIPGSKSFSARNLWFMKRFYETYQKSSKNSSILKQLASEIPWWHNIEGSGKKKLPHPAGEREGEPFPYGALMLE